MSQYLTIYLQNKENPDNCITLCEYCTSVSRTIPESGAFSYRDELTELSEEKMKVFISNMENYIKTDINNYLQSYEKDLKEIDNLIIQSTHAAIEVLLEKRQDIKGSIEALEQELSDWNGWLSEIVFCLNVYKSNSGDWNLVYTNC